MKYPPLHILPFIALMLAMVPAVAQVSVRANASRDKILIGEPVSLSVEAYVPLGADVKWFPADSIPHFTVTSRSGVDTVNSIDGKKIVQVLGLTSFDSGRWTLPPFEVYVGGKPYYSDSLTIDVAFISFDPKEDYHDIKDIVVVENKPAQYIPWIVAALAIASLAGIVWLWRRNRKKGTVVQASSPVSRLSAYQEAVAGLARLREKGAAGDEKAFYVEMNDILRKYVFHTFSISAFEKTNEELIAQLSGLHLPQKTFDSLSRSLRISDFVKFARYRPSEEDNILHLDAVRSSIDVLNNYSGRAV